MLELKQLMELMMENDKTADLISKPLNVINIGLEGFATELKQQGVSVTHVDWSPPCLLYTSDAADE